MPIYDYYCSGCIAILEVMHPNDDETMNSEIECPDCGKVLVRMISAPPFVMH